MWVRSKVLEFQYDSTITQVVQYDTITNTVSYPIVNPNYRIITNCSVSQRSNKQITIKVNKSGGAVLSGSELTALQSYLSYVLFAGIQKTIISASPDYLMVECLVYYDGQYVNVIQQNVELAITNYMANLPYDGAIEISELEDAIQLVSGVEDLVFVNVELRGNSTSPANATKLVSNSTTLLRNKNTYAGLAIQDTATGRDFATTITYIPK
jgi:hypothetical protein